MRVNTIGNVGYVVTSSGACTVTAELNGATVTLASIGASGGQTSFMAVSGYVEVSDEGAVVLPYLGSDAQLGMGSGSSGGGITVDQTYSATSTNPQSGVAVAQAVGGIFTEAQRAYLKTLFNNTIAPTSIGKLQTEDDTSLYVTSHTTQKFDYGEIPVFENIDEATGETVVSPIVLLLFHNYGYWNVEGPQQVTVFQIADAREFPDIQLFFRTGDTVPTVSWDTDGTGDIHWLNTEARNVAPKLEPNTSYHLGVSYEFGHYVVSVTYDESTLEEEVSDE